MSLLFLFPILYSNYFPTTPPVVTEVVGATGTVGATGSIVVTGETGTITGTGTATGAGTDITGTIAGIEAVGITGIAAGTGTIGTARGNAGPAVTGFDGARRGPTTGDVIGSIRVAEGTDSWVGTSSVRTIEGVIEGAGITGTVSGGVDTAGGMTIGSTVVGLTTGISIIGPTG